MARPDKYALGLGFVLMLIVTGCAQGEGLAFRSPFSPNRSKVEDAAIEDVFASIEDVEATDPATQSASVDPDTFKDAIKELQELRRTDPEMADEFAAQVQSTDPAMLGKLVQTWKAVLAYKRQQQEQEEQLAWDSEPFGEEALEATGDDFGPPLTELTPGVRDDVDTFDAFSEDAPFEDDLGFEETAVTDLRPFDRTAARPEQPVNYETFDNPQDMQGANQAIDLSAHSDSTFSEDFDPFAEETGTTTAWDDPPQTAVDGASDSELQRLIAQVERESGPLAELPEGVDREVYMRFLYLMAGNREQAMQPIAGFSSDEQQFWTNMLWAMSNQLDRENLPNDSERAAQTVQQLSEAAAQLRARATLEVKNLAFCQRIQSFGSYDRFQTYEFAATEPVLLYAEVNNFSSESTPEGYRTVLRSTIEVLDLQGHQVWKQQFDPTEDLCESYRRDYFHSYNFSMPERIYAGPYILKLTIEDQLAGKVAEGSIEFEVIDK